MSAAEEDPWAGWAFDAEGRLVDTGQPMEVETYGPPPAVRWVSPDDLGSVYGRRCAVTGPAGPTYDLRCVSEVYASNGGRYLNLVPEHQWYRWHEAGDDARPDRIPRATCFPTRHVWVELPTRTTTTDHERTTHDGNDR